MVKHSKRFGLAIAYMLIALFIGGCSSKSDVGFGESETKTESTQSTQGSDSGTNKVGGNESSNTNNNMESTKVDSSDESSYINVVTSNVNGKDISLSSVHFAFDKYNLSDEMRIITQDNYGKINPIIANNQDLKIKLEGNCDEWGTDEYNYALGLKRAKTVKDTLINDGVSADKIVLVSFGESNPLCTDKTADCWKKNRRVDHKLLP